jgi:gliding motility associated protien GldN
MKILKPYKLTAVALLFSAGAAFAQTGTTDPTVGGDNFPGVNKDWLPSKTPDGAYDRVAAPDRVRYPIPWQNIRETDILWKKRVWREIDTREKQNVGFRYAGDENSGGGMFIEILIDAIKRGKVTAYENMDDRFTTVMTKESLIDQLTPKPDTITVVDPTDGSEKIQIVRKDFDPEKITKYRIKEDWIFDRNVGQMVVRIVGLAPVIDIIGDGGDYRGSKAMFWLYYPDPQVRNLLANYEVFNPHNDLARYTWDEFFEARQFSSKITKVSGPWVTEEFKNRMNPMESLYEGKRSAEEIFNKEHDMWVY